MHCCIIINKALCNIAKIKYKELNITINELPNPIKQT